MKINTKRMTLDAVLTTIALTIFIVELQLPSIVPIPGVKLGLANIITLFALYCLNPTDAFVILLSRIFLASIFSGRFVSMLYSLTGGVFCFFIMWISKKILTSKQIWICSVLGAAAHNTGQIVIAIIIMGTTKILLYLPFLLFSAIVTGFFTGTLGQYVINRMKGFIRVNCE